MLRPVPGTAIDVKYAWDDVAREQHGQLVYAYSRAGSKAHSCSIATMQAASSNAPPFALRQLCTSHPLSGSPEKAQHAFPINPLLSTALLSSFAEQARSASVSALHAASTQRANGRPERSVSASRAAAL